MAVYEVHRWLPDHSSLIGIETWHPHVSQRDMGLMTLSRYQRHRGAATVGCALIVSFAIALMAPSARAHAIVRETQPGIDETVDASPQRVTMSFNEPVEVSFGGIRVFDTNGDRVDEGSTEHVAGNADQIATGLKDDLAEGTYTVAWRIVSIDGHPISEAFVFHVGAPGQQPEGIADQVLASTDRSGIAGAVFGLVRWLHFCALLALAGSVLFVLLVWSFAVKSISTALGQGFQARIARVFWISWTLALLTTLAGFVLQGAVAGDVPIGTAITPGVLDEVASTRYGVVAIVRLVLLVLAPIYWRASLRPVLRRVASHSSGPDGSQLALPLALGVVVFGSLLATPGLAGHPGSTPPIALNVAADVLHMLAAAAWIGGLFILSYAVFRPLRHDPDAQSSVLLPVVSRFSAIATVALATIVITGVLRSWAEVGALRALTSSTYGWVLLTKLGVFMPLVALGAFNNRRTLPRLKERAQGTHEEGPYRSLRRLVAIEVALGVVVVAVTALLVNLPPARVAAGVTGPFIRDVRVGDLDLNVLVDPNEVGENFVHLTATTPEGAPARVRAATVVFRMPSRDIGPIEVEGNRLAPGHYVVQGRQLSVPGQWQLEVVLQTSLFDEQRTTVSVTVND